MLLDLAASGWLHVIVYVCAWWLDVIVYMRACCLWVAPCFYLCVHNNNMLPWGDVRLMKYVAQPYIYIYIYIYMLLDFAASGWLHVIVYIFICMLPLGGSMFSIRI